MNQANQLFKFAWEKNVVRVYLVTLVLFWLLGGIFLVMDGYEQSFLTINRFRFGLGDMLAPHLTHLGDGLLLLGLIGLILTPRKSHWNWAILVAMLSILGVILLCKNIIFEDWDRPMIVFAGKADFYYNSLSVLKYHAFPSGHSAAIAGGMMVWVLATRPDNWLLGIFMGLGTIIVAMTRVYIGVHFFGDVLAGTFLGTLVAFLVGGGLGLALEKHVAKYPDPQGLGLRVVGAVMAIFALLLGISLLIARYY